MRGIGVAVMCRTWGVRPPASARALLDAEPMLLVDDGDRDVAQVDALLDQRVRADEDLRSVARALVLRRSA